MVLLRKICCFPFFWGGGGLFFYDISCFCFSDDGSQLLDRKKDLGGMR